MTNQDQDQVQVQDPHEIYYPTIQKAKLSSNRRESIFPNENENENENEADLASHGPERIRLSPDDNTELPFSIRPSDRPTKPPTFADMATRAAQLSDEVKRTNTDYRKLREEYEASIVSHNQLAEENDQLKTEMTRIEGKLNHQEDQLTRYRALLYERGLNNSRSNSKSPESARTTEKTTQRSMRFPDPPILTDGKDPDIDDWLVQTRGKMEANADHMPTERQRMVYVQGRLAGLAMKL